ncbi:DNA-binding protein [Thioalkalivibrio denitrificans]|uniref:DNA-binding protein n=1 Tax=Thioalkalivibrio denitrificans TaxID=108003 RepID=A0A1V3NRC7_9GAMM|nr:helix-turn-helix domain-containing protein [Thioalkalivibrio denitrificans]OOG27669.1 DNA-binding protein [Thioalkalivibrio denitrificans]
MTEAKLLTTEEAAHYLRLSSRSLIRWRVERRGPPVVRAGRKVMYRLHDLDAWLDRHTYDMPRDQVAR